MWPLKCGDNHGRVMKLDVSTKAACPLGVSSIDDVEFCRPGTGDNRAPLVQCQTGPFDELQQFGQEKMLSMLASLHGHDRLRD